MFHSINPACGHESLSCHVGDSIPGPVWRGASRVDTASDRKLVTATDGVLDGAGRGPCAGRVATADRISSGGYKRGGLGG
jgi:hypothetical protein